MSYSHGGGTAKKGQKWYFEVGGGVLTTRKEKCKHLNIQQFLGIDFCPKRSNLLSSIADVIIHLVTFYLFLKVSGARYLQVICWNCASWTGLMRPVV